MTAENNLESPVQADLNEIAYRLHCALHERKGASEFAVIIEENFPGPLGQLLRLTATWGNDVAHWVESFYGIKTETGNIHHWHIDGTAYEAFSEEYFINLHRIIETRYRERKALEATNKTAEEIRKKFSG